MYLAKGERENANKAYQLSLNNLPSASMASSELRMKLHSVSMVNSQIATKNVVAETPVISKSA